MLESPIRPFGQLPTKQVSTRMDVLSGRDHARLAMAQEESLTVDELVRSRASLGSAQPVISYPRAGTDYVDYPLTQLDTFAFRTAKHLAAELPARASSSEKPAVIGLLGPSNLEYLITMLALSKLGHSVLFLSTRISIEAYVSLVEKTHSRYLLIQKSFGKVGDELQRRVPGLIVREMPGSRIYSQPVRGEDDTNMTPHLDPSQESSHVAWIIHSSGSTGLPKPIFQTHKAAIKNYAGHMNMSGFVTLPLYHNHGICCLFRTIHSCKRIHLYNAELPLTKKYLLDTMNANDFEIFYGVPYALKLLAESDDGIRALRKFKLVMFGGSACPDSLGDKLVASGVHLVSHYGATETGQLMTSFRPWEDKEWDWLRPSDFVSRYLRFEERGPGIFELVVLDGYPSKVTSNRPDGSYATKDLFLKHPTKNAFKYYARLDDTITLMNGEKVNPLEMEGRVRQHDSVAETVVFGVGKSCIGMIAIRSPVAEKASDEDVLEGIWPIVDSANESMPAYGRLSKSMIRILPADTSYPCTDKGTVIRQAFYRDFKGLIESTYNQEDIAAGTLDLSEPELKAFIRKALLGMLPLNEEAVTDDSDFFGLGMDSLQATRLRSILVRHIDTKGVKLGLNVAFDYPTINALAQHLQSLRSGTVNEAGSVEQLMESLIGKYSQFGRHVPTPNDLHGKFVVVTGATGSLGSHVAAKLSTLEDVSKVYCLVRAGSTVEAYDRLVKSMRSRRVYQGLSDSARHKLIALRSDLSQSTLGIDHDVYTQLTSEITDVIHCAWSVNFNLHLSSFERDSIAGVANLLALCLQARRPRPASFNFCSSISAVMQSPGDEIPESLPAQLSYAQNMGYAQSKLVGEHVCVRAAQTTGITARVLRIGQVVGDTQHGIWNPTEAIPLMLQCATTIGALPTLDESPLWLPVDTVAATVVDISLSSEDTSAAQELGTGCVFNILSSYPFHWTRDLLPYLRRAGLEFDELDPRTWLQRLRHSDPDPASNPPIKLIEFFASKYDTPAPRKSFFWHTERARRLSPALASAQPLDQELITKMVDFFRSGAWKKPKETAQTP